MYNDPSGEFVFAIFVALPVFWGTVAFEVLSGGIGAEVSRGNFWQGAVTGGVVRELNYAIHKQVAKFKIKKDLRAEFQGTGMNLDSK